MEMFSEALANMSHQFLNYSIAFVLGKHNLMPTFGVKILISLFILFRWNILQQDINVSGPGQPLQGSLHSSKNWNDFLSQT